jgi:hypothetical protein
MGCGYLRADFNDPKEVESAWRWRDKDGNARGPKSKICPGFTTQLHDVLDIGISYVSWDKGELSLRLGGEGAPSTLIDGLEVLNGGIGELMRARMAKEN